MRTKFAAIMGMIVVMAFLVLPVQAAAVSVTGSGAETTTGTRHYTGTQHYTDAQRYTSAQRYTGSKQYVGGQHAAAHRKNAVAEADVFRRLTNGWHYTKGNWYYIRGGRAVRGWVRDGGKWYFLGSDGKMQTGWIKDNGKWYYLASGGAMQTGWLRYNGKWYYLMSGGAMKTGWLRIGDRTFYLTKNGVLDVSKTRKANAARKKSNDQAAAQSGAVSEKSKKKAGTKGDMVADYALQFVGNPYVYGGCSLTHGTDCSGFVMLIYGHFGVSLPHYDAAIRTKGKSVPSLKEARAGDIICYYGHVAIYLGDGRIVHASNSRDGIKISERADYRTIASIRRIFE